MKPEEVFVCVDAALQTLDEILNAPPSATTGVPNYGVVILAFPINRLGEVTFASTHRRGSDLVQLLRQAAEFIEGGEGGAPPDSNGTH